MKQLRATRISLLLAILGAAGAICAPASAGQAARDRGPAPSPAAFAACVNHKLGDRVTIKTASGKKLTGKCRPYRDQLAARTHVRHKKDKGWFHTMTSWF